MVKGVFQYTEGDFFFFHFQKISFACRLPSDFPALSPSPQDKELPTGI